MSLAQSKLSVLFVGMVVLIGCNQPSEYQPPPPPEVTVAHPESADVQGVLELTGTTVVYERVDVRARVKGFLEKAPFTEGQMIAQGDLLFVIDPRPFQADLDAAQAAVSVAKSRKSSAEANLTQAKAQVANDKAQYTRAARAAQGGAVTQAELDELRAKFQSSTAGVDVANAGISSAQAEIDAALATVQQTQLDLGYTQVISPIDGRVGKREVDVGNLVGAGESTLLTTVIKYDPIFAEFTISEAELMRFIRRSEANGESPGPHTRDNDQREIRLGLSDEEGHPHIGKFDYADLAVDQATGTYLVRGLFPNTDSVIPPGAFVRLEVPLETQPRLLVPDVAVGKDQNGSYVAVVDADGTVTRKRIVTGRLYHGKRVVKEGLTAEDNVVVNGVQKARPGIKVTVKAEGGSENKD